MPLPRKQKPRRKPFVVTVAQAATVALLPGCFSTVTQNPPYVEEPGCPNVMPTQGDPCSGDLTCNYEFDVGCGPQPATATCKDDAWSIDAGISCNPPPPDPCPVEPPTWEDPCNTVLTCSYELSDGCGQYTTTATCDGMSWSIDGVPPCNPPEPTPDPCFFLTTEEACNADATCRWLVPGCGVPALPEAGCFAQADCTDNVSCWDGAACGEVVIDPCHNKPCDVCGIAVKVCLTGP